MKLNFEIIIPTQDQIDLLYEELRLRKHVISHQKLPKYADHKAFVHSNPYRGWWIIRHMGLVIGTCYLSNENSMGINIRSYSSDIVDKIISFVTDKYEPLSPIASVRDGEFFVNIPSSDLQFIDTMDRLGYSKTQISYSLRKRP